MGTDALSQAASASLVQVLENKEKVWVRCSGLKASSLPTLFGERTLWPSLDRRKSSGYRWALFLSSPDLLGPAWSPRGDPQGCRSPLLPPHQGQLELLRRLFTEALYEEALSQVSGEAGLPLMATAFPGQLDPYLLGQLSQSWLGILESGRGRCLEVLLNRPIAEEKQVTVMQALSSSLSHPQWFTPDGFRSLFALVGTNGQGIGTRLGENVPELLH